MKDFLTAGKLAEMTNISKDTLRFYEREGLISDPPRSINGYRKYPIETVKVVNFIIQAKGLGFSLEEIKGLIFLSNKKDENCKSIHLEADEKVSIIQKKIDNLELMKKTLNQMSKLCRNNDSIKDCHFLHTLWGIEGECNEQKQS